MSRSETARSLAREQTQSSVASLKSTEESQRELAQKLDRLALDLSTISQRFDGSLAETEQTLETATKRAEKILSSGLKSIREATAEVSTLPQQVEKFRLVSLALVVATGALISTLLLIALLILRPQLIQMLWQMAHALR